MNIARILLLTLVATTAVFADDVPVAAPEIDGSTAASAVTLVGGGLLLLRSRRK